MKHFRQLLMGLLITTASLMQAQGPPDPPGLGHGTGGDQPPGGNAPVGSGLVILLSLAAGYGAFNAWESRCKGFLFQTKK